MSDVADADQVMVMICYTHTLSVAGVTGSIHLNWLPLAEEKEEEQKMQRQDHILMKM